MVLHAVYVEDLRGQLQGKEEKKAQGKNKGRINTDGQPKILTQDKIFNAVVKAHEERDAAKEATTKRKDAKTKYVEAVAVWKVREMDRKERNSALKSGWINEVRRWEAERDSAKYDQRKPRWTKPKMPAMEKAVPKPKVADFEEESEGGEGIDGEDEEECNDEAMANTDGGESD
jgi:hypothetical protein